MHTGTTRTWNAGKRGLRRKLPTAHSTFSFPGNSATLAVLTALALASTDVRPLCWWFRTDRSTLPPPLPVIAWMPAERSFSVVKVRSYTHGAPASHRLISQREAAARLEAWGKSKIASCSLIHVPDRARIVYRYSSQASMANCPHVRVRCRRPLVCERSFQSSGINTHSPAIWSTASLERAVPACGVLLCGPLTDVSRMSGKPRARRRHTRDR